MSSRHAHLFPSAAQNSGRLFPRDPGQVGPDLGDRVPEQFLHLLLGSPTTSIFGTPASSRRTTLASGSASPVHHSWRMAKEATGRDRL